MLVIFDCDGVLVDSEGLAATAFARALAEIGVPWSAAECLARFRGLTLSACFALLRDAGHLLPDDFAARLHRIETPLFAAQLQAVAGVREVLEQLCAANIPFCVASNGRRAKIEASLTTAGLREFFAERVFSAEQVACAKPSPELFLLAAESMGVPARYCVVVEDSVAGVTAAKAAQMKVIGYGDLPWPTPLCRVHAMAELPARLRIR